MHFLLLLWLSQHPSLIKDEEGSHQLVLAALALLHDPSCLLRPYERSLLSRVASREMTLSHMLAYLREQEQG
ncbi:hypothetical protein [Hymenobacter sp.]|jgi:hypothetical protein|uniref:hypothetical protein n=1 Tax=Hymenobacter sp. TaxID=1898978 RepID=UPI002EDAE94B